MTYLLLWACGFLLAFTLHLLVVLFIWYPGITVSLPMSAGMILAWLYVSSFLKSIPAKERLQFFKKSEYFSAPLKYFVYFFFIYALINFIISLNPESGEGWFDLDPGHEKLRGLSGFWLAFYSLAFVLAFSQFKKSRSKD